MDIRMPVLDGVEATRRMPETKIIILTTFDLDEYVYEALRAGAVGFLLKDAPADDLADAVGAGAADGAARAGGVGFLLKGAAADDLADAVRVVAAGDALLAPSITRRLIGE